MAKKKEEQTAVAKRTESLPVGADVLDSMRQDAGQGTEQIGRDDVALPFIRILQQLSPELSKNNERYVEEAEAGMFYNTVTQDLWDGEEEGIRIIPCYYEKKWLEWIPRKEGGGFVAEWDTEEEALMNKQENTEVSDTANHYVLIQRPSGEWQEAVVPMTSTKLKTSRRLNSLISMKKMEVDGEKFTPPAFAFIYVLGSAETENDQGRFFVPTLSDKDTMVVDDGELYAQAKQFYQLIAAGEAKVDYSKMEDATVVEDGDSAEDDDNPDF